MGSVDVGNYNNRRLEGMLNIPIVGDKLDLRMAGEWTKRDGYDFNELTDHNIDGRDLWSGRVSLLVHPVENLTVNFVWEHFQENDDRARSTKQLCTRDNGPSVVDGPAGAQIPTGVNANFLTQGCGPGPLYGPTAFETPSAGALPFVVGVEAFGFGTIPVGANPYASLTQSQNLRVVDSLLDPKYRAKNDTFELNAEYNITEALTLTSQTGFNKDFLYSTEDYNRFTTASGLFQDVAGSGAGLVGQDGQYCDPQLGCSSRLVGEDLSQERAQQFSQELRLASNFNGPLNFVVPEPTISTIRLLKTILSSSMSFLCTHKSTMNFRVTLAPIYHTSPSMPRLQMRAILNLPTRQISFLPESAAPTLIPIRSAK